MMNAIPAATLRQAVTQNVALSIAEDEGTGDRTAALIDPERDVRARVIVRHEAVVAGRPWVDECFRQVDPRLTVTWHCDDGERAAADATLLSVQGPARSLLTAERIALNWLQTLSGVATRCRHYADRVAHTHARLLDTRKTLPGLRIAQKYAVRCGGCANHRIGLYDGVLIKENHIASCGSITAAVERARAMSPDVPLEVETETEAEVAEAIAAGAERIMLDEFPLESMARMVERYRGRARFEASGGITEENLAAIAETGVDFISLGVLTKDVTAADLSLRILDSIGS